MDATSINTIVTIIAIVVGIIGIIFGTKFIFKKYIGRDDRSIKIGDNVKINDSFNNKSSIIKKD